MTKAFRVYRWARWSLVGALVIAIVGKFLDRPALLPFWGGLIFAFGEAALVGGLADWFAVRALFAHPFGIPFPHTAIIPRNRRRIIREISALVQDEWLPRSLLTAKVESFDLVGQGVLPIIEPLKPHLREVLRSLGRDVLDDLSLQHLTVFLARGLAGAIDAERVGPLLSDLARRAREQGWLEPLLREMIRRLQEWAESPRSREIIYLRLRQAASAYRERGWFKSVTLHLAEALGGVDLAEAADVLQGEIRRFATDQLAEDSQLQEVVRDGLGSIERKLREDPQFLEDLRSFVLDAAQTGTLTKLLEPVLASLRQEGRRELESEDSHFLRMAQGQIDAWVARLAQDPDLRDQVNAWCRRLVVQLIEQHHSLVGVLVEEQLNRLSEEKLTELLQAKVGEDLNWIRLNGTFVGGLVGMLLYLCFSAARWVAPG
jgi:uncharacterized membrane-anchored protein YjiN (DUF445 family)